MRIHPPFLPPTLRDEQNAVIRLNSTAYDVLLSEAVIGFLRNQIHGDGHSVSAFRSRNDHFLDIIRIIAAKGTVHVKMDMTRDDNTPPRTELDATIYEPGYPELVVVQERADSRFEAEREICNNFIFLPQYAHINQVVGIVIIGNEFRIGFVHRYPKEFRVIRTLTAGEDGHVYRLVQSAVNIGLWFRATMNRGVLEPSPFKFGTPLMTDKHQLTIFRHKFKKVLYQHDDIDLKALSKFYKSIRSKPISNFEYPVTGYNTESVEPVLGELDGLKLVMKPVGLEREPRTSDELKDCLVCILTALQELHGRGYVHLDLRWRNIIIVAKGSWYIIDGEYVRKEGDPYPQYIRIRDGDVVDFAVDLTLLGKMLNALADPSLLTSKVQTLIDYLIKGERSKRSATRALQLVQGW